MNENMNSGKPNADTYQAEFLDGTESKGDYIIFGVSEDEQFLLGVKPLIEVFETSIRFAARLRGVVNPEKEPALLSTQGGELISAAFKQFDFNKMDESRCSIIVANVVEYEKHTLADTITENTNSLLDYVANLCPTTKQRKESEKYLSDSYMKACTHIVGKLEATKPKASVSHLSLAKTPDKKVEESTDVTD